MPKYVSHVTTKLSCLIQYDNLHDDQTNAHPVGFLPRDATQSAIMPQYVVRLSVRQSVCNIQVLWSDRLEYFENNFTAG